MYLTNMRKKIICVCICIAGIAGGCTYYHYTHPNIKKVLKETELRAVPKEYKQNIREENKVTKDENTSNKKKNTNQKENSALTTTTDSNIEKQEEIKRDTPYIPKYSQKEKISLIEEAKPFYRELKRDDRGWDFSDDFLRAYENFEKEQTSQNYSKLEELLGLVEVSLYNTEFGGE